MTMHDTLYRAIKRSQPSMIRKDKTITSALFKDDEGVSVDKKMGRTEEDALNRIKNFFNKRLKAVAYLSEKSVDDANAYVFPCPTKDNPYHAEIYKNYEKEMLSNLQRLQLADSCRLIFFDENVKWITPKDN